MDGHHEGKQLQGQVIATWRHRRQEDTHVRAAKATCGSSASPWHEAASRRMTAAAVGSSNPLVWTRE